MCFMAVGPVSRQYPSRPVTRTDRPPLTTPNSLVTTLHTLTVVVEHPVGQPSCQRVVGPTVGLMR